MNFPTHPRSGSTILANFALTMLKAMLVLAFLGLMLMSDQQNKKFDEDGIKPPIFALIVVTWPNDMNADIDVHIKCPNEDLVNFVRKEACFANLERDARGSVSDWAIVDGQRVEIVDNREVISFRNTVPGEWIVNVHWYSGVLKKPVPVRVQIISLNPSVQTVFTREVVLNSTQDESHVLRFQMNSNKTIGSFDFSRPTMLLSPSLNRPRN